MKADTPTGAVLVALATVISIAAMLGSLAAFAWALTELHHFLHTP